MYDERGARYMGKLVKASDIAMKSRYFNALDLVTILTLLRTFNRELDIIRVH